MVLKEIGMSYVFQKYFLILSLVGMFVLSYVFPVHAAVLSNNNDYFKILEERLVLDGFNPKRIKEIYSNPKTVFSPRWVSTFFIYSESKLNYDQFTSKKSIKKARKYMEHHKKKLDDAQKEFGVDKTVITAIILVETRLGTYTGKHSILNTLSTIASLSNKGPRDVLWNSIVASRRISEKKFNVKADKKSKWAYDELKAFLKYTKKENIDPLTVQGSFAGAIGIAQFMPSNILTLAKDGDLDGKIDLFTHADAIVSIANYLRNYGWKPGITKKDAHKVLYSYNHSNYYVDTLIKISNLLKG